MLENHRTISYRRNAVTCSDTPLLLVGLIDNRQLSCFSPFGGARVRMVCVRLSARQWGVASGVDHSTGGIAKFSALEHSQLILCFQLEH